jgi:3-carboxy-cis,cis-muconate cycloisomerase
VTAKRCSLPFDALFVPAALREAVSDRAWLEAMLTAERALAVAEADIGVIPTAAAQAVAGACRPERYDPEALAEQGRRVGNPAEPLVRALREQVGGEAAQYVHWGATSQDVMDTAAVLVAQAARELVDGDVGGVAAACARLADEHRGTVLAARTLLQQATPTTFGLKAAGWLVAVVHARVGLRRVELPVQLGGASGTLAALGDRGVEVLEAYARELALPEPAVPWHTTRLPFAELGAALSTVAGVAEKIALDLQLLGQTEIAEVREPGDGGSSTMPHKRNPVGSTLARACALRARAAAGVLTVAPAHEHERAAGAWHAEWGALSDALAFTGGAVSWVRQTLDGLEVDAERMRENVRPETLSEAERFGLSPSAPEEYLGAANALVDRALAVYREDE